MMECSGLIKFFKIKVMKFSNYLFLLLLILSSGCSNDGNEDTVIDPIIDPIAEIEFNVNGTAVDVSNFKTAFRDAHSINVGANNDDTSFLIAYDENGHFGKVTYLYREPINGLVKRFTSYANFSSNYFNFHLISYDAVNKRTKVSFDGYIYKDPLDLNSESKFINGSFDLPIKDYVPTTVNLINEANINGNYWRSTNLYQKRDVGGIYHNLTLHSLSDDQYKIMISFNDQLALGTPPGIYNFVNTDVTNKVQIAKFNVATTSYTLYNCTGTLSLNAKWGNWVQGTYNLTGVNPINSSDVINVQNGNFKLLYNPNN